MSNEIRKKALYILENYENASSTTQIHNAVIDLRRNAIVGDERVLYAFLEHHDAMVVSATLYTLFEVHSQQQKLRELVEEMAGGDPRDDMAMPIQTTAITLLARFGKDDAPALKRIVEIAERKEKNESADACAWLELSTMHGVEWSGKYTDELMMNPESEASEQIRNRIRGAIASEMNGN